MAWKKGSIAKNKYERRYYQEHRERILRQGRDGRLRRQYGITQEDYDRMFQEQGGVCAICGRPPKTMKHLNIDHDHKTGKIRGLLCPLCNKGLQYFQSREDSLLNASKYIAFSKAGE